ncbi:unnamed protein product, partial [Medioppia subpectinata]
MADDEYEPEDMGQDYDDPIDDDDNMEAMDQMDDENVDVLAATQHTPQVNAK